MAASREFFNNTVSNAQHLLSAKDPSEAAKLGSDLAKPNADKWVDYSRSVYELVAGMQKELTSVMESQSWPVTVNTLPWLVSLGCA